MHDSRLLTQNRDVCAAMLADFGVWSAISPNNRESICREIRRLEKAEKAEN